MIESYRLKLFLKKYKLATNIVRIVRYLGGKIMILDPRIASQELLCTSECR